MKTDIKTLIHAALFAEAKPIIRHFKLKCVCKIAFNIYKNSDLALVVSGIGTEKTKKALKFALANYEPKTAINIGIAGCKDQNIELGTLFCTTHKAVGVPFATLSTFDKEANRNDGIKTLLADMEGAAFLESIPPHIKAYVFKVVSDYLEPTSVTKEKTMEWIQKSIPSWSKYA